MINKIVVDNVFSFIVALDITRSDVDYEPQFVEVCRRQNDWLLWKSAMQAVLNSFAKRKIFGLIVQTPEEI